MSSPGRFSTWLEIDLSAIANNVSYLKRLTGVDVMAVVKANGYGHGLAQAARAAEAGGAAFIGVARLEEALQLREAGLRLPILVLGHTPEVRFEEAVEAGVDLTLFDPAQLAPLSHAASGGRTVRVHVKVDTGMSRLGVQPKQALDLIRDAAAAPGVEVRGLFTHFALADEPDHPETEAQERRFMDVLAKVEAAGLRPPVVHAANSAAALSRPASRFDLVRCGIAAYGLMPSSSIRLPPEMRPALAWKARLVQVRELAPGTGVSYGHDYRTRDRETIGTVAVGYGDGYRRVPGASVLVGGRRAPIVGRVCMDQIMVSLDGIQDAHTGAEVVLIGRQGQEVIRAEDLAALWNTIPYEVACGLSARVPRVYSDRL